MAEGATIDFKSLVPQYGPYKFRDGRAKGEWLNVTFDSPQFQKVMGLDGEGMWVAIGDLSATITMTFLQSAEANDVLSALYLADLAAPGGLLLPFYAREKNGRTVYAAAKCRIVQWAPGLWSDGGSVRTWTLQTTRLNAFIGGVGSSPNNPNP